jgi:hypothetical protein
MICLAAFTGTNSLELAPSCWVIRDSHNLCFFGKFAIFPLFFLLVFPA